MTRARRLIGAALLLLASPLAAAVELSTLVTGLSAPIDFVDPPDGLPHRFIAQQGGLIRVWDGSSSAPLATPWLDLSSTAPVAQRKVLAGGERGLLSIAAHPDYATNGLLYLYYTSTNWDGTPGIGINAGDIVIERYTRDAGNPELGNPASGHVVLVIPHSSDDNHNGGKLNFGPDGYLYVTVGDGGGGCDSTAHSGQDVNQLLGKMLRIDVDGADAYPADPLRNYAIPAGNPLLGFAGAHEIWALGLRNPFRFSFDRGNGDIYIGDVGQDDWEELDLLPVGAVTAGAPVNFGWPCEEGFVDSECADPPQGCLPLGSYTEPVRVEPNAGAGGNWQSIIAGFRYRGANVAADLGGRVVYGDAANGQVWAATPAGIQPPPGWPSSQIPETGANPYAFGQDQLGELYVLFAGSARIDCIHATGQDCTTWATVGDVFLDGFESGNTSEWSSTVP